MNPLRPGARRARKTDTAPTRADPAPAPVSQAVDYAQFLRATAPQQARAVASHRCGEERVWLKKAGARHGLWRYRLLALVAGALRLDVLAPVPNPGGEAAIAIEARRLRALRAAGLRVPAVLAQQSDALLISDLGESGSASMVLQEKIEQAAAAGPATLLIAWRGGLDAIADVHARGGYLSQAFDRNLVLCPDGTIGFIDFEDDPGDTLALPECQVRDWLSYLHSTAALVKAAAPHAAGEHWHAALAGASEAVRERLAHAARRMRWLRHLPASRRWGRDTQRVRAAALLLARWYEPQARRPHSDPAQ